MKKFATALSILLMLGGITIAGGCDNHNKSYNRVKNGAEAPQIAFVLSMDMDGKHLMKRNINFGQTAHNVQSEMGEILAQDINFDELAKQFPEIYNQIRSYLISS